MENKKKNFFKGQNSSSNKPDDKGFSPNGRFKFNFYWLYIALFIGIAVIWFTSGNNSNVNREVNWDRIEQVLLDRDYSRIVVVNEAFAEVYIKPEALKNKDEYKDIRPNPGSSFGLSTPPQKAFYIYKFVNYDDFRDQLRTVENQWITKDTIGKELSEKSRIIAKNRINVVPEVRKSFFDNPLVSLLGTVIFFVLIWTLFARMMRPGGGSGGGIFNVGKSKARLYDKDQKIHINFNDVAGLEGAKVEIMEVVDFLKSPAKYTNLGGKIPKGILLVGPPGTGKTLLAKAVAGEAKVPFFSLSGSDFVEMFVGVGASRVRDLFKTAKEKSPCIIFIDEIDAIGRARGKNLMGSNDERENTLNQLLTEMDGFEGNTGVIILAATNRADILDKALLRAGRFDRQIYVELPDINEREDIFGVHMRKLKFKEDEIDRAFLAKQTPGFSGADIANVCNEAALIAARSDKKIIEKQDFLDAIDRIVGGLEKKTKIISPEEKRTIAYHESGHASVSWLLKHAHPLVKVTIVPRGKALGAAWYLPEERQITTFAQMLDEMTSLLGGRAAEEVVFNEISTGALNDLERVTKMAHAMVAYYGLNKNIGNLSFYDSSGQSEYTFTKPYSEKTAEQIDKEISALVSSAYDRAKDILLNNREKLDRLASILIEREVIFREDVEEIFGPRPFEKDEKEKKPEITEITDLEEENNNSSTL